MTIALHLPHRRHHPPSEPAPDPAAVRAVERAKGAVERCQLLDRKAQEVAAKRDERTAANGFADLIIEAFSR